MKLPEGWPTDEMIEAGFNAYHSHIMNSFVINSRTAFAQALQAAFAAAPSNELRDAASQAHSLLGELLPDADGGTEKEMYRVFDLLRCTLGIYDQLRPLSAAPTPPEPEHKLSNPVIKENLITQIAPKAPDFLKADDKLRKAAEEALAILEEIDSVSSEEITREAIGNLRAALRDNYGTTSET